MPADPTAVQTVEVTIDALVGPAVQPFWRALLEYQEMGPEDLVDPHGRGPSFWFYLPLQLSASASSSNTGGPGSWA